jgi:hypothetical protein
MPSICLFYCISWGVNTLVLILGCVDYSRCICCCLLCSSLCISYIISCILMACLSSSPWTYLSICSCNYWVLMDASFLSYSSTSATESQKSLNVWFLMICCPCLPMSRIKSLMSILQTVSGSSSVLYSRCPDIYALRFSTYRRMLCSK